MLCLYAKLRLLCITMGVIMNFLRLLLVTSMLSAMNSSYAAAAEDEWSKSSIDFGGLVCAAAEKACSSTAVWCSAATSFFAQQVREQGPVYMQAATENAWAVAEVCAHLAARGKETLADAVTAAFSCCSRGGHLDIDIEEEDGLKTNLVIAPNPSIRSISVVRRRASSESIEQESTVALPPAASSQQAANDDIVRNGQSLNEALEALDSLMFGEALTYFGLGEESALQAENARRILEVLESMEITAMNSKELKLHNDLRENMQKCVDTFETGIRSSSATPRQAANIARERISEQARSATPARSSSVRRRRS